ncbi:hypothetical protein OC834_005152 [Tilletia horrida]|uniref:Uncharacterized protein n=1 Tax=Tilletia horrida TaxID=155126 RepID=A0AAN6JRU1_9BASI|nr:hypothetical protein OC834_005152 [Tilletia horrida]KAK0533870.1 hypothetical protein OC842_002831 [Tilletia horrida]KAK0550512.1 hypothetical protein OC844_006718 [Tilletia horrida]
MGESSESAGTSETRLPPQTVIHSPFFRSEIVSAYARDALQADAYPTLHAASLFEPPTDDDTNHAQQPALTPANIKALQEAAQAISAHLVLLDQPQGQQAGSDGTDDADSGRRILDLPESQRKLAAARLRSHLAATLLLLNEPTRALAHLSLASDALRPPRPRKQQSTTAEGARPPPPSTEPARATDVDSVRITLWILMERACLTLGKNEDLKRIQRWRTTLEMQRNTAIS